MSFYVYILYSASRDRYYIGHSSDIDVRLIQHNSGRTPSTKPGRPWVIVYTETYSDKKEASNRESEIKRMKSRTYLEKLISGKG